MLPQIVKYVLDFNRSYFSLEICQVNLTGLLPNRVKNNKIRRHPSFTNTKHFEKCLHWGTNCRKNMYLPVFTESPKWCNSFFFLLGALLSSTKIFCCEIGTPFRGYKKVSLLVNSKLDKIAVKKSLKDLPNKVSTSFTEPSPNCCPLTMLQRR